MNILMFYEYVCAETHACTGKKTSPRLPKWAYLDFGYMLACTALKKDVAKRSGGICSFLPRCNSRAVQR